MRSTHTVAELQVSGATYDEIAKKLRDAEYDHVFGMGNDAGLIDMSGIGLTRIDDPSMLGMSYAMLDKKSRDNYVVTCGFFTLEDAQAFHAWCCLRSRDQTDGKS